MKNNYINLLHEGFDFNDAIEDSQNGNNTLNDISNKLQFDNAIVKLRSIIKTTPYKHSEIDFFNDNQCIVIKFYNTPNKTQLENSISIMFIIENDNILVYYEKHNDYMPDDMNVITKITISFLQYLMNEFNIKSHKIYIVRQSWELRLLQQSELNGYKTYIMSYKDAKFLLDMINNGFTNIQYIVDKEGINTLSYDHTFIKPENVGNIIFTNSSGVNSDNIYTLNISKLFDYITTHDILPEKGYVLFNKMLIATTITDEVIKYLNLIATCKFNDNATVSASQNINVKITKADVKRVIDNVMYVSKSKENKGILKITQAIKDNASHKLYARLVLSAILSGDIDKILNQYEDFNKFVEIDVTTLKVYYNYVIDDIKNNGPVYNLILSNLK